MEIIEPVMMQVIGIVVAAACGWLAGSVKRLSAKEKALYEGMKAVLRKELVDDFEKYVQHGNDHVLTIERKQEIDDCYQAYAALGGNGTGKQMYERLCQVRIDVMK